MRIKFRHPRSQDPYVPSSARELPRFLVGPEPDSDARRATAARRGPERFQTRRETVGARDGHVEDAARARAATTNRLDRARTPATGRLYVSRMVNPSRPSPNPTLTFFLSTLLRLGAALRLSLLVASRRQHLVALRSERDVRAVQSRGGPSARDDASARAVQHGLLQTRARQTAVGPALRQTRVRSN